MKTVIIACETIKAELEQAQIDANTNYPILYMESGLHDIPKKLNQVLQETIQKAEGLGAERILLGFGFCGNSVAGVKSSRCELILPRIDDCVTMFLGSREAKKEAEDGQGIFFMTSGWANSDDHMLRQYDILCEEYGEEEGREIYDMMFGNYTQVKILDTHCFDLQPIIEDTKRISELLHLTWAVTEASNQFLVDLMTGPWPEERFLRYAPNTEIPLSDLVI